MEYSSTFEAMEIPENTVLTGKEATQFKPGNHGKPKGTQNKLTRTVKESVLAVFNDLQSDPKHNLKAFAKKYPRDFYNIAARLIPTEISGTIITAINITETVAIGCKPLEENAN